MTSTIVCIDNSPFARNGEPDRLTEQREAVALLYGAMEEEAVRDGMRQRLLSAFSPFGEPVEPTGERELGLIASGGMRGPRAICAPVSDYGAAARDLGRVKVDPNGRLHLAASLRLAMLMLKTRTAAVERRIVAFVCSPVGDDEGELEQLGVELGRANITLDCVLFGPEADRDIVSFLVGCVNLFAIHEGHLVDISDDLGAPPVVVSPAAEADALPALLGDDHPLGKAQAAGENGDQPAVAPVGGSGQLDENQTTKPAAATTMLVVAGADDDLSETGHRSPSPALQLSLSDYVASSELIRPELADDAWERAFGAPPLITEESLALAEETAREETELALAAASIPTDIKSGFVDTGAASSGSGQWLEYVLHTHQQAPLFADLMAAYATDDPSAFQSPYFSIVTAGDRDGATATGGWKLLLFSSHRVLVVKTLCELKAGATERHGEVVHPLPERGMLSLMVTREGQHIITWKERDAQFGLLLHSVFVPPDLVPSARMLPGVSRILAIKIPGEPSALYWMQDPDESTDQVHVDMLNAHFVAEPTVGADGILSLVAEYISGEMAASPTPPPLPLRTHHRQYRSYRSHAVRSEQDPFGSDEDEEAIDEEYGYGPSAFDRIYRFRSQDHQRRHRRHHHHHHHHHHHRNDRGSYGHDEASATHSSSSSSSATSSSSSSSSSAGSHTAFGPAYARALRHRRAYEAALIGLGSLEAERRDGSYSDDDGIGSNNERYEARSSLYNLRRFADYDETMYGHYDGAYDPHPVAFIRHGDRLDHGGGDDRDDMVVIDCDETPRRSLFDAVGSSRDDGEDDDFPLSFSLSRDSTDGYSYGHRAPNDLRHRHVGSYHQHRRYPNDHNPSAIYVGAAATTDVSVPNAAGHAAAAASLGYRSTFSFDRGLFDDQPRASATPPSANASLAGAPVPHEYSPLKSPEASPLAYARQSGSATAAAVASGGTPMSSYDEVPWASPHAALEPQDYDAGWMRSQTDGCDPFIAGGSDHGGDLALLLSSSLSSSASDDGAFAMAKVPTTGQRRLSASDGDGDGGQAVSADASDGFLSLTVSSSSRSPSPSPSAVRCRRTNQARGVTRSASDRPAQFSHAALRSGFAPFEHASTPRAVPASRSPPEVASVGVQAALADIRSSLRVVGGPSNQVEADECADLVPTPPNNESWSARLPPSPPAATYTYTAADLLVNPRWRRMIAPSSSGTPVPSVPSATAPSPTTTPTEPRDGGGGGGDGDQG